MEQSVTERELYEKKMRAQLDEWKAELAKIKAQTEGASADAQLTWKREMEELEREIEQGEQRLEELGEASGDAWESVKQGAESAWASLSSGFRKASERLKG